MHPYGGASGDPFGTGLGGARVALPSGPGPRQRIPVANLLTAVAAVALDLGVREAEQGLEVGAGDVVEHEAVPVRIDASRLRRADPVRDAAGGDERHALALRARAQE